MHKRRRRVIKIWILAFYEYLNIFLINRLEFKIYEGKVNFVVFTYAGFVVVVVVVVSFVS